MERMMGKKILRMCTMNGCDNSRITRSLSYRCEDCRRHRYWCIDTDEYNSSIDCTQKQMMTCECGHKYIRWNRSQHLRTLHHQEFVRKEPKSSFRPTTARMCQKKNEHGRIHGRWSERVALSCPKCIADS
jgi:hypothetical protein